MYRPCNVIPTSIFIPSLRHLFISKQPFESFLILLLQCLLPLLHLCELSADARIVRNELLRSKEIAFGFVVVFREDVAEGSTIVGFTYSLVS
jgi:hypothetical protein